jgi:maltose O-acetyltransferase
VVESGLPNATDVGAGRFPFLTAIQGEAAIFPTTPLGNRPVDEGGTSAGKLVYTLPIAESACQATREPLQPRMSSIAESSPESSQRSVRAEHLPAGAKAELHWRLLAVELLFGCVPPFVISRLRTQALRAAGVSIGSASTFWGLPTLIGSGDISARLSIGRFCGFNDGCFFELEETVTIADHVSVGHEVMFLTRGLQTGSGERRAGRSAPAKIVIEEGVWLGGRSVIMPGVTVGAGSVVGAGVVVNQNVKENTLLTGGPSISIARWR